MANIGFNLKIEKNEMKLFQAVLDDTPTGIREAIRDLMEDSLEFMVHRARALYRQRVRDPKGSQAKTIQGVTVKKSVSPERGVVEKYTAKLGSKARPPASGRRISGHRNSVPISVPSRPRSLRFLLLRKRGDGILRGTRISIMIVRDGVS